jgi:hypothetical protein
MELVIRARQLRRMTPLLEAVLSKVTGASGIDTAAEPSGPRRAQDQVFTARPDDQAQAR